jgi:WD40 repeat protein
MKKAFLLLFAVICLPGVVLEAGQPKGKKPFIEPPAIHCLALSPDGKILALADRKGDIRLWSVADKKNLRSFPIGLVNTRTGAYISTLAFSPDSKSLAIAGGGRLEIWDVDTGKMRVAFKNETANTVNKLVRGDDGVFKPVKEVVRQPDNVSSAKFSADGKTLISSGKENIIKLWDAATGKEIGKLAGHQSPATHLAVSRDGKTLASGTFYYEIKVWDLETRKEIASLANGRSVYGLALSSDGKKALSSHGNNVLLWDVAKKEPIETLTGASGNVGNVAFSPNDKLIIAQGIEFVVWDAKNFENLATFEHSPTFSLVITPDSRTLLTCDQKGNIRVHELPKR